MDGYEVKRQALRRQATGVDQVSERVAQVRATLSAAFDHDRHALGGDHYGAELDRKMPEIEGKIFDSFRAYVDELDGIADKLRLSADNYGHAEGVGSDEG